VVKSLAAALLLAAIVLSRADWRPTAAEVAALVVHGRETQR
jgi:hypothetical protein